MSIDTARDSAQQMVTACLHGDRGTAAGVDPDSTQNRERAVPCQSCGVDTFNIAAGCDRHWLTPAAARRAA